MRLDPRLLSCAGRQHGLVTVDQWCAFGSSRATFYRQVCDGALVPLAPKVAALVGQPIGPLQRIAAGVLSFGPDVAASHTSGTWVWGGIEWEDEPVDLTLLGARRRTSDRRFVLHRPVDRHRVHRVFRYGLPVTTPTRTLLDLAAARPDRVAPALEAFLRRGVINVPMVATALARTRRHGRPGVAALQHALDDLRGVTDSELETVMRALFERAGMTGWIYHAEVEGYEVDFCFPAQRLIVEVDGWAGHGANRRNWERTAERDLLLAALGWQVVHLTWKMVVGSPDRAMIRLRAALQGRQAA